MTTPCHLMFLLTFLTGALSSGPESLSEVETVLFLSFGIFKSEIQYYYIYSIDVSAPTESRTSLIFSASSLAISALRTAGASSTNFFAWTRFIPSIKDLTALMVATFLAGSNFISLTVNEVWTAWGAAASSSSCKYLKISGSKYFKEFFPASPNSFPRVVGKKGKIGHQWLTSFSYYLIMDKIIYMLKLNCS